MYYLLNRAWPTEPHEFHRDRPQVCCWCTQTRHRLLLPTDKMMRCMCGWEVRWGEEGKKARKGDRESRFYLWTQTSRRPRSRICRETEDRSRSCACSRWLRGYIKKDHVYHCNSHASHHRLLMSKIVPRFYLINDQYKIYSILMILGICFIIYKCLLEIVVSPS